MTETMKPNFTAIEIDETEHLSAYQVDRQHGNINIPHGFPDHTGYRCSQCAMLSDNAIVIEQTSGDHWQSKQIKWQEECDIIFKQFDEDVAAHFPVHLPQNCTTCPQPPQLPVKPIQPFERLHD